MRLLILVSRPSHLEDEEAQRWLAEAAEPLMGVAEVLDVRVLPLSTPPSSPWPRVHDYLIELRLAHPENSPSTAGRATIRDPRTAELFGDLQLLGMRPVVALAG